MDNPLASCGVSDKEWETNVLGFALEDGDDKLDVTKTGYISDKFVAKLIDSFPNLSDREKRLWKSRCAH